MSLYLKKKSPGILPFHFIVLCDNRNSSMACDPIQAAQFQHLVAGEIRGLTPGCTEQSEKTA